MIRTGRWLAVPLLVSAAMLASPASSPAVVVTVGRPSLNSPATVASDCGGSFGCQSFAVLNTGLSTPGALLATPADGTLTSWRAVGNQSGSGGLELQVLRPKGDGSFVRVTTSPAAGAVNGTTSNPVSLPVAVGDMIGLFGIRGLPFMAGDDVRIDQTSAPGGTWADLNFDTDPKPTSPTPNRELLYNATVDLFHPRLSGMSPTSGAGGTVVTITGQHLAVATGVTFGGVHAASFSGDNTHVIAVAPARPAGGKVDVQVTTAGGTSTTLAVDVFTYPVTDHTPPNVLSYVLSPTTFRAVNVGGSVFATRVGTRVSYKLSEAATTTFTVQRALVGRRSGKRCVAPNRRNRRSRRCTRLVGVRGSFTLKGVAGTNRFKFSGRMRSRALAPGKYRLVAVAKDAAGNRGKAVSRAFTIGR